MSSGIHSPGGILPPVTAESQKRINARKLFRSFGFLTAGRVVGDACTFLLFVLLSRRFGQEGIGWYSFAMGFTGFFVIFADFGLHTFSIKELSRLGDSIDDHFGRILSLRLALAAVILCALLVTIVFLPFSRESKLIIVTVGLYQLIQNFVNGYAAVFTAREDTHVTGFMDASFKISTALAGSAAVLLGANLVTALAVLPTVGLSQLGLAHTLVRRKYGRPLYTLSLPILTKLWRRAVPYAVSMFLFQIHSRIDVVLLGFLIGAAAAGVYNVAYRIVFFLSYIPLFVATAVFPQASRLYRSSESEFEKLYHKSLNMAILAGVPMAAGLWLIAPGLIGLVFGQEFAESIIVLRTLSGLVLLTFLTYIMGTFLMSCDREVEWTTTNSIAALFNVVGNCLLIPAYGVQGAAVSTLLSQILLLFFSAARLKSVVGWPRVSTRLAISGAGSVSFCLVFTVLPAMSLVVVIPACVLLYVIFLFLFKDIRANEVRFLLDMVNR